jgi:hypothetical protein
MRPARLSMARFEGTLGWRESEVIEWSPIKEDEYAEYFDEEFLGRLGIEVLRVPLNEFWPRSGPRWDGLARTRRGKIILVEAKAYIEEAVDFGSKTGSTSSAMINAALAETKAAFGAAETAAWHAPLYQYANRLAYHFLEGEERAGRVSGVLVLGQCVRRARALLSRAVEGWNPADGKCTRLGQHRYRSSITSIILAEDG